MRPWEWVGEPGRGRTLCSIESSPHQAFSSFCPVALLSGHLRALALVFTVDRERLHVDGMCVAGLGPSPVHGAGSPAFLSTASEINSWVWAGLFGWEWWSPRSLIVPIN